MSPIIVLLLLLAGLSEAAGRILPLIARRPGVSRTFVVGLLTTGTIVDGAVFALWPVGTWALAGLVLPASVEAGTGLAWTPGMLAPLVFCAVLAFPLLGPLLHLLLCVGVGAGLAGSLAASTGLNWWLAASCVAVAGLGLALAVEAIRRVIMTVGTTRAIPATAAPEAPGAQGAIT
jgi:hypothetical protein